MAFFGFTVDQIGWMAAGFLGIFSLVVWIASRKKPLPPTKRVRYVTEIPSKMIIEEDSQP